MTDAEAREWLGLRADDKLNDYGQQCVAALAGIDPPDPAKGDMDHVRVFGDYLEACQRMGIYTPGEPGSDTP